MRVVQGWGSWHKYRAPLSPHYLRAVHTLIRLLPPVKGERVWLNWVFFRSWGWDYLVMFSLSTGKNRVGGVRFLSMRLSVLFMGLLKIIPTGTHRRFVAQNAQARNFYTPIAGSSYCPEMVLEKFKIRKTMIFYVFAAFLDDMSTLIFLGIGLKEGNPIIAWLIGISPVAWILYDVFWFLFCVAVTNHIKDEVSPRVFTIIWICFGALRLFASIHNFRQIQLMRSYLS